MGIQADANEISNHGAHFASRFYPPLSTERLHFFHAQVFSVELSRCVRYSSADLPGIAVFEVALVSSFEHS